MSEAKSTVTPQDTTIQDENKKDNEEPEKAIDTEKSSNSSPRSLSKDKIALKLILASGKSSEFIFSQYTSVGEVTEYVYKNWPEEWSDEKETITSHHVLRLIYQGRFLHENVTFIALNLHPGRRTVMHLVPREKLPQLSSEEMEKSPKTSERSCCCNIL